MAIDFGKMAGPLPLGAWLVVAAGGIGIYMYTKKQSSSDSGSSLDNSGLTDPNAVPGQFIQTNPPDNSGLNPKPTDNNSWGQDAITFLISKGFDPAVSDSAIRKYLDGSQKLSAQEYALVKMALAFLGPTPTVLPPPVFGPPTEPKPKPKPSPHPKPKPKPISKPHVKYYTVKPGDTLGEIAKHFRVSWQSIFAANRAGHTRADKTHGIIQNANHIQAGWRIIIP